MRYPYIKLINPEQAARMRDAAVSVLLRHGYQIKNEKILRLLEEKGLQVDYSKSHVSFTEPIIEKLEECAKKTGGNKSKAEYMRRPIPEGYSFGRNMVQYVDYRTNIRRQALRSDNIEFIKAAEGIKDIIEVAPIFTACDQPPRIEVIVGIADAIMFSGKDMGGWEMLMGCQLPYIEELLTIKKGKQERITGSFASMSRFTLDETTAGCLVAVAERNGLLYWGTNSCIFPGVNGPMSLAGAAVMAMAEMIGGWVCGYALNEEVTLGCIPVSGTLDMRSTRMLYSTPGAVMQDALLAQVFDMLYQINTVPECSATYVDSKYPGIRALSDKTYKHLALFAYTGCSLGGHFGMLEGGSSISPAQIMLDLDLNRRLERLAVGIDEGPLDFQLNDLLELGPHGDYMTTDHTLENFREYLFADPYMDYFSGAGNDISNDIMRDMGNVDTAQNDYDRALMQYKGIELPREKEAAVESALDSARRNLL